MVGPFPNNELLESIAMCKLCWQKKTIFRQYNELERDYLRDEYYKKMTNLKRHLNIFD